MYVKTLTCSRKVAVTVFTEMCSASFFMEIKMLLLSKKFSGTDRENMFQEICPSQKKMLGVDKKPSFLLKNIYLYNLWNQAALKTLEKVGQ